MYMKFEACIKVVSNVLYAVNYCNKYMVCFKIITLSVCM